MTDLKPSTLSGYILEEILAYLIRNSGYHVIADPEIDPRYLSRRAHGLVVQGRGAEHQIDVLGELAWVPAFTYPVRLCVEAKDWKRTVGLPVVREQVASLTDINQNYNTRQAEDEPPTPLFHYVGTIFSTSGFTAPAAELALAHKISLVDLTGDEYEELRSGAKSSAERVIEMAQAADDATKGRIISSTRDLLRSELGTPTLGDSTSRGFQENLVDADALDSAVRSAQDLGELIVGMCRGPFMILLKADDVDAFLRVAKESPTHRVEIHWSSQGGHDEGTWRIQPVETSDRYSLSFRLPEPLFDWVFQMGEDSTARALEIKDRFFSRVSVYRRDDPEDGPSPQDRLFTLLFDPDEL